MSDGWFAIMVDAQTGELYRAISAEVLEPITPAQLPGEIEWDGGFDEESAEAIATWSEKYYWQPLVYENSEGWFIYNRRLFQVELQERLSKSSRNASSWMTSGVLHSTLGEWVEAVDDFAQAIQLAPDESDFRYYRGLSFLIIRDLDKALSDFQALPQDYRGRSDALEFAEILRGEKKSSFVGYVRDIDTDIGVIPIQLWIGTIPLAPSNN